MGANASSREGGPGPRALGILLACVTLLGTLVGCSSLSSPGGSVSGASGPSEGYVLVNPGKLTVVSDLANPPFDYFDTGSAVPVGFEVDLMQAVAQKMGLTCEYLPPQKFDSIIPMIKQGGRADVGASNFTITDERLQEIDFTDAYIDSNQGVVTSADVADAVAADYRGALDAPEATLAVQAGSTGEAWAQENLPDATIVSLDDPIAALTGVQSGLYTAAVADLPVMEYEVKNSYTALRVALQVPTGEQYGIVVSKSNPGLTAALNEALEQCQEDGTMDALKAKWFGSSDSSSIATASTAGEASVDSSGTGTVAVSKATARPNESGGDGVIGGQNTRLTWEGTVYVDSGVSSVRLTLPAGASFDGSSTRITVLDGLSRQSVSGTATPEGNVLNVSFGEPVANGSLLRLEVTDMRFAPAGGDSVVSGSYVTGEGATGTLEDSSPIATIGLTPLQFAVNWLDGQPWVAAWNSVPFLNMFFKPQLLATSFAALLPGWLLCLLIVTAAYPFAIVLGLLFALLKISRHRPLRALASVYINVLRGTPLFLQIYVAFFGLPMLGVNIDNTVLGIIVMALNSSAYQAEIYRAGIQSIPTGQYEAAASLGMSRLQTMLWIILPQTVRRVIPTVTSDFITSYKDTSLLSSVGVMELMMFSKNLTTTTGNITPYIAAAVFYLIVTLPLIRVVGVVERRLSDAEHGLEARPLASDGQGGTGPSAPAGDARAADAPLSPLTPHTHDDGGVNDAQ
ncbi:ABC transporter substrate-binding protein/permease [Olsenella sp. HMSC062G07]|uniref:ABC transporter substrate-binding protein/permease n=1 Tax=Olsenella sp. HMSC062G07 TaxID=1739330 RepID=UPI0008A5DB38|nr:ABC transporter substrate-binding protein/permease [Olsenella sp. HMSC062G07]OFK23574.1 amino acid ABC transporter permease [Olsenella sp. HMSC062G07]